MPQMNNKQRPKIYMCNIHAAWLLKMSQLQSNVMGDFHIFAAALIVFVLKVMFVLCIIIY